MNIWQMALMLENISLFEEPLAVSIVEKRQGLRKKDYFCTQIIKSQ
jgi:hypothetical protein